ncbi:NAD-dependent epimerase/dehydratase family protein [Lysobacter sp. HDW10]|uniref:NAD-dependent epimerase/dehydratase family protein n=1 Tax=Lysobacter sp. HDW10 TaxID=2714936 RepID=UPI00140B3B75|nr:NAD-dependent epimerase/dehydratase family protein [Lysobacter sp. HDW10]QIK80340.1 NAD-dependent epimerase/dehydratase family protein [Lysobacter sp. HDW10]
MNANRDAVLVLGAGGFIGRHVTNALAQRGTPVIAATRKQCTFDNVIVENVVSTFDEAVDFNELLTRCQTVIHTSSISTPGSSSATPQIDGNLRPTLALLEAMQSRPDCKLIYLSSAGTLYGEKSVPARESDQIRPRSYHGAGKAAAEHFIQAWARQYGGSAVVLRPSNIYGPGQLAKSGFAIIPTAMECILKSAALTIWGNGEQIRDYLYIDDLVRICVASVEIQPDEEVLTLNVSSGMGTSLNELLAKIEAVAQEKLLRIYEEARPADVNSILISSDAAQKQLSWSPTTSLEEGLTQTWMSFNSLT